MARRSNRRDILQGLGLATAAVLAPTAALSQPSATATRKTLEGLAPRVRKIAIEEHLFTPRYTQALRNAGVERNPPAWSVPLSHDYGEGRIAALDAAGIDMQILSLSNPGIDPFSTADAITVSRQVNDEIAATVQRYPDRFSGFCCLPLQDPSAAARELERAVTQLRLPATMININVEGRWMADEKYDELFAAMNQLRVPMYLHADGPSRPPSDLKPDGSNEDFGLHIVHDVMRIINGPMLEKYPHLQFILGHGGESLPFWLNRLDSRWRRDDRKFTFSEYFIQHFHVTLSAQCWPALLDFLIASVGAERIMFATDYPYESLEQHVEFIDNAEISEHQRHLICHLNAERLFGV